MNPEQREKLELITCLVINHPDLVKCLWLYGNSGSFFNLNNSGSFFDLNNSGSLGTRRTGSFDFSGRTETKDKSV